MQKFNSGKFSLIIESVGYGQYILHTTRYNKPISMYTTDAKMVDACRDNSKTAITKAIRQIRKNDFLTY